MSNESFSQSQQNLLSDVQIQGTDNTINFSPMQIGTHIERQIWQVSPNIVTQQELIRKSPYKGLKHFNEIDSFNFFGREEAIEDLAQAIQRSPFNLVLGASGSGKSSVVRAGVIPKLAQSYAEEDFYSFVFTPGSNPFEQLYICLAGQGHGYPFEVSAVKEITQNYSPGVFQELIGRFKVKNERWLFFIDQFEELFTNGSDIALQHSFIQSLVQAVYDSSPSVHWVVAMRSDFLDRFSPYPTLSALSRKNLYLMAEMHRDELRMAIERPAANHGVVFEEGLVKRIIDDVQGETGYLPLLQYTLNLLWRYELNHMNDGGRPHIEDRHLNHSSYDNLKGVRGALEEHVETIYQQLAAEQQKAAKIIFLKLINITGGNLGRQPVSRRASLTEFQGDTVIEITLRHLIDQNLLVSSDDSIGRAGTCPSMSSSATVEIAHESLLTSWSTLKRWIDEDREAIFLRNWLLDESQRWQRIIQHNPQQADQELLQGSRLEQLTSLSIKASFERLGGLSEIEAKYISASLARRDRLANEAARRQQEREAQLAKERQLNADLRRALTKATLQEQSATVLNLIQDQPVSGLALAIQAMGTNLTELPDTPLPSVLKAAAAAVETVREKQVIEGHSGVITATAVSPDGQLIASGGEDGQICLWDIEGNPVGTPFIASLDRETPGAVTAVQFHPDGNIIASGSEDGSVYLWDLKGQPLQKPLQANSPGAAHWRLRRRATGLNLLVSPLWALLIWLLTPQEFTYRICYGLALLVALVAVLFAKVENSSVVALVFTKSGTRLISSHRDHTIRLWNSNGRFIDLRCWWPTDNPNAVRFKNFLFGGAITALAAHPFSNLVITARQNGSVRLWHTARKLKRGQLWQLPKTVTAIAISPHGETIALGCQDGTLQLRNRTGRTIVQSFSAHGGKITSLTFSADGEYLASGGDDTTVRLWTRLCKAAAPTFIGHQEAVTSVSFSPDLETVISGSRDSTLRLWSTRGNTLERPAVASLHKVSQLAFSPSGDRFVSGQQDGSLSFWDAAGERFNHIHAAHGGPIHHIMFSPDGQWIVTSSRHDTVRFWSASGEAISQTLEQPEHLTILGKVLFVFKSTSRVTWAFFRQGVPYWAKRCTGNEYIRFSAREILLIGLVCLVSIAVSLPIWLPFVFLYTCLLALCGTGTVSSITVSPNGKYIAGGTTKGMVLVWNLRGKLAIPPLSGCRSLYPPFLSPQAQPITALSFSPDSNALISNASHNGLYAWDLRQFLFWPGLIKGHTNSVTAISTGRSLPIDEKNQNEAYFLVSASDDNMLRLCLMVHPKSERMNPWTIRHQVIGLPFSGHHSLITAVAIHPSQDRIISVSHDQSIRLWDLEGTPIGKPLCAHQAEITSIAPSPVFDYFISGSKDGTICLWSGDGELLKRLSLNPIAIIPSEQQNNISAPQDAQTLEMKRLLSIASSRLRNHPVFEAITNEQNTVDEQKTRLNVGTTDPGIGT